MSMQGNHMVMRSFRRDEQVINKSLARGTVRRIVRYAGRYRLAISALVVTLVLDALLTVAQPLLFRRIIDDGVDRRQQLARHVHGAAHRGRRARRLARDARRAVLLLPHRRGPDLRPAHPGLRPRAADADRVLHPHPDRRAGVAGSTTTSSAPSRRSPRTLSGVVSQRRSARRSSLVAMLALSWQITLVALVLLPLFLLPARWVGRRLQAITREEMQLNAEMSTDDDRALQRRRRAARQAVRPARRGGRGVRRARPGGCATSASRIAMYEPGLLHRADPGRVAGDRARLRRRRQPRHQRHARRSAPWSRWPRC